MNNSAVPSKTSVVRTTVTVTSLCRKDRPVSHAGISPIRLPWTDELERRRKAVARWRGSEAGLKETMMRE